MSGPAEPAGPEGASELLIDDERIGLPSGLEPDATYDVLINDRHVWSVQPRNDTRTRRGRQVAAWPKGLRRHLVGRAEVELRDHLTGALVGRGRHVFQGAGERTVDVVDRQGNPLVIDKYGKLIRPLSSDEGDVLDELMDHVEGILATLTERAGVPAFIAYGTLLGAVRNGRLIGHDNDVDLAYASEHDYPVDVIREAFRVERALLDDGWNVRRGSGARLNVRLDLGDGSTRFVDVFTAHWVEGVLYIPQDTGFRLPRETILPLTTVELLGRQVPAPRDYERLLAETYGEGWRTPDPSFKYHTPEWLARRIGGWFGGLRTHRKQWDTFYGAHRSSLPTKPSRFAKWVAAKYGSSRPLVDLGTGNARDARFFARRHGRAVTAVDYAIGVMKRAERRTGDKVDLEYQVLNLYDTRQVLALGTRLARLEQPADLYARFLLHSLEDLGRENVLRLASMSLRAGGYLFLEFRTLEDRDLPHHFTQIGRRYLDPDAVVAEIEARGGRVVARREGHTMARFRGEDPHVCRIVAAWAEAQDS